METVDERLNPPELEERFLSLLGGEDRRMKDAIDLLLDQALRYRASDVHVEPYRGAVRIRFRVDGYFRQVVRLRSDLLEQLISRVKVMAGLVVHRRDIPQEGRLRSGESDFRVSILPTVAGEKLALRVFDSLGRVLDLTDLGFFPELQTEFERRLSGLSGTILLTGPAGSGKTTTLYAALRYLHDRCGDHAAITTIEDPVEYDLGLFSQVQVKARSELTFARALTAVLRQDPRVIMLGEIRDPEAGEIAMRAGLTGHLVLSTIHAGTACGVITRLTDMGIEPYIVNSSLKAVLAQRLARGLCPDCTREYDPDPALIALAKRVDPDFEGPFLEGGGCEACLGTGYRGRFALTELLSVDERMGEAISRQAGTRDLEQVARECGFAPLLLDGVRKVRAGRTTLAEVVRAVGLEATP